MPMCYSTHSVAGRLPWNVIFFNSNSLLETETNTIEDLG